MLARLPFMESFPRTIDEIQAAHDRLGHPSFRNQSSSQNAVGFFCSHAAWASASGRLSLPFSMTTYWSASLLIDCLQYLQSMTSGILISPLRRGFFGYASPRVLFLNRPRFDLRPAQSKEYGLRIHHGGRGNRFSSSGLVSPSSRVFVIHRGSSPMLPSGHCYLRRIAIAFWLRNHCTSKQLHEDEPDLFVPFLAAYPCCCATHNDLHRFS
jgi:hypothetical protein